VRSSRLRSNRSVSCKSPNAFPASAGFSRFCAPRLRGFAAFWRQTMATRYPHPTQPTTWLRRAHTQPHGAFDDRCVACSGGVVAAWRGEWQAGEVIEMSKMTEWTEWFGVLTLYTQKTPMLHQDLVLGSKRHFFAGRKSLITQQLHSNYCPMPNALPNTNSNKIIYLLTLSLHIKLLGWEKSYDLIYTRATPVSCVTTYHAVHQACKWAYTPEKSCPMHRYVNLFPFQPYKSITYKVYTLGSNPKIPAQYRAQYTKSLPNAASDTTYWAALPVTHQVTKSRSSLNTIQLRIPIHPSHLLGSVSSNTINTHTDSARQHDTRCVPNAQRPPAANHSLKQVRRTTMSHSTYAARSQNQVAAPKAYNGINEFVSLKDRARWAQTKRAAHAARQPDSIDAALRRAWQRHERRAVTGRSIAEQLSLLGLTPSHNAHKGDKS
jgi:hypothetical protein